MRTARLGWHGNVSLHVHEYCLHVAGAGLVVLAMTRSL